MLCKAFNVVSILDFQSCARLHDIGADYPSIKTSTKSRLVVSLNARLSLSANSCAISAVVNLAIKTKCEGQI
jgi:hypothetical protein